MAGQDIVFGMDLASGPDQLILTIYNPTLAMNDVLAERLRQINSEGWTAWHDDHHEHGELARAAATYALHSTGKHGSRALTWPWAPEWWKPTTRRRDLVKAAALLIAEIDRLDRLELDAAEGGDA